MDEETATRIYTLMRNDRDPYIKWDVDPLSKDGSIILIDGYVTADELEAIAYFVRKRRVPKLKLMER